MKFDIKNEIYVKMPKKKSKTLCKKKIKNAYKKNLQKRRIFRLCCD